MTIDQIISGKHIPQEINVIIEISAHSHPIKYEIDKSTQMLFVDRFIATGMTYPCNYGYIPHTLSEDNDPIDVLVMAPFPIMSQAVISCRPIGLLKMEDESGIDAKILAVPIAKVSTLYNNINDIDDVSDIYLQQIKYFFEHYKGLEDGKWVKIIGWFNKNDAYKEILTSIHRCNQKG